ncbi:MAG TPA: orotidine-5'-phosphate decarboxylase [Leptospiraceae bacterium]|nr:orotidine-5'-phosphate decarboxylase [Leptospiraceae bacterium]HMW06497.1 orotidine-5'-phosphate decarboxylase [Leptospiraceae bacterium]HMX33238.1 orotidine-5'-phosphate decarboxylase [Leptospiraceae bacterium]HMY32865.1 orotidine-5'-phosphate decarboxylase [Leptospiraceae bacterium]HMZ66084.1 orotidine-5'-phosphate decarboxylase [Leptospiraceae bacterium]
MSFYQKIITRSNSLRSLLCIGLDPEWEKLPASIKNSENALYTFCKEIVDATHDITIAYKPNIAFFERFGFKGIEQFEKLIRHITSNYPQVAIVADIKRGDLANTAKEYAKYYFGDLKVDSLTLSPYMGSDSIEPFFEYKGHAVFLLCLTSNPASKDLQKIKTVNGKYFYEEVANFSKSLNSKFKDQVGLVVGATHPDELGQIRNAFPELAFLIPGYGAQGGNLSDIMKVSARNSLINSSRSILFNSNESDFALKAREKAIEINREMKELF